MRFLWTISNWKHTGPVEPSLDLARAVADAGNDVRVEVGRPPSWEGPEAGVLRDARSLPAAGVGARLAKHAFFWRDRPDRRRLARWLRAFSPDHLVATLANDHRLLLAARRGAGRAPVTRLWFADGESDPPPRERVSLLASERVVVFGDAPAARLRMLGVDAARVVRLDPPLDVDRVRARVADVPAARRALGVPDDAFLVGIVARIQPHRRWEVLWAAVSALDREGLPFVVVVLGRGTRAEEVGRAPVREAGLDHRVRFAGYLQGEAYASALAAFDAQVLLVPGSDPTCRALREGMALGVPSIATRRGLLPSIVEHETTGLLVQDAPADLAQAIRRLAGDRDLARRLGESAHASAKERFDARRVAARLLAALPPPVGPRPLGPLPGDR